MGLGELVRKLPFDHPYRWDGSLFGKPKLWTPAELTLKLWLDAYDEDTITESGGAVSQWDDKSGEDNHATQTTEADKPTTGSRLLNGYNVLDFEGIIGDYMDIDDLAFGDEHTIYMVAKYDTTGSYKDLLRDALAGATIEFGASNANFATFYGNGSSWDDTAANTPNQVVTSDVILGVVADGVGGAIPYWNGTAQNSKVCSMPDKTGFSLNGRHPQNHDGYIAEVVIADTALSTEDRQKLEGYLAWKWGLEGNLPSGHPYKSAPPTV